MLPKLVLPPQALAYDSRFASWNVTLHRMLASSGEFDVTETFSYGEGANQWNPLFPDECPRGICDKVRGTFSVFRIDSDLIGADAWDTQSPTSAMHQRGLFNHRSPFGGGGLNRETGGHVSRKHPEDILNDCRIKMIAKIQWRPDPFWDEMTRDTGIPVVPWTIFPTREFNLSCFDYDPDKSHQWVGTLTGARRFGRQAFCDAAAAQGGFYLKDGGEKDDLVQYVETLKECRWGISLGGKRDTDKKNRREIEFASCGMPLAINYSPHYCWPFRAGKEYVLLETPDDLKKLKDIDPAPFAEASKRIFGDHLSPRGMAATLLQLLSRVRNGQNPIDEGCW